MMLRRFPLFFLAAASFAVFAAGQALADQPQQLGVFHKWTAFQSGTGDGRVCYVLSSPTMMEPSKIKRDPAYFLINDWPGRKAKSEPEIVPGYQYQDSSHVTAEVGSDKFDFFTKNDNGAGGAWVDQPDDETRLIAAMRRGAEIVVIGTSKRGTMTHDTYSLSGLSDALQKAHDACGL
jgi:hypothetical protein